eukprot:SAG11_NODE_5332_length_1593_cov_2.484605_1_plen_67_part_10
MLGDHDEAACAANQGLRTATHDALRDLLALFLRQCRFRVTTEVKTWDVPDGEAPGRAATGRRVPDII